MTVPLKTGNILLRLMSPAACNIFCYLSIEEDDFCFKVYMFFFVLEMFN